MNQTRSILELYNNYPVDLLKVSSDARLPERICYGCCTKLEDSFRFINEVVSNNEILLELVNPESSKVEQAGYALNFEDASGNESPGRAPKPPERVPESPERTHEPPERAQEPPERVQESPGWVPESPERALEPPSPRQRNNRKSRETTPAGSNEDDSTGTCSDGEPSDAPASADELDAVNLIVKKFINNRETKSRPPCSDKRRKVHRCSLCDKVFQRKSNLIDHLRFHSQTKLYQCVYCDKSFVQSGNLTQHLRTHTSEKPFGCTVCSKRFSQSGALKTHMNIHLQLRPFECTKCNKAFTSSSDLNKHMLTHDRKKRYCCPMCSDRVFTQKVHLRMHLTRIHPRCNVEQMVALGTTDNDEDTKEPSSKSPPPPTPRDPSPTRRTTPNDLGPISDVNGHGLHAAAATRKTKQK